MMTIIQKMMMNKKIDAINSYSTNFSMEGVKWIE